MVGTGHARVFLAAGLCALALAVPAASHAAEARPDAAPAEVGSAGWRDPASWRRLRLGMSQLQVLRILGEPGKVTRYYAFERWEYPDALGRRLNFDERGRLVAWGAWAR